MVRAHTRSGGPPPVAPRTAPGTHDPSTQLTEEALHIHAERLHRVIDSIPQLVCMINADGNVAYCNAPWREVVGCGEGEAAEPAIVDKLQPDETQRWLGMWRAAFERGTSYEVEHRLQSARDGIARWYLERGAPLREPSGKVEHWLITAVEIDDHRRREDELRALLHRKDEFFATLLHELRNPLAPIASALELLGRSAGDAQVAGRARGIIQRQLRQLTRLVDDLLDVSRIERGDMELQRTPVDVADVVAAAVETARPLIDLRRHHLAVAVPRACFTVQADPVRLAQVLTNLLINAAKYTNPGGYISVRAEQVKSDVLVHVRDSGSGIAREQLAQIFELFAQAASTSEARMGGLGIGLAVARQLIQLHGGSISAHSEGPGRGSEFTISLPAVRDTPPQRA